MKQLTQELTPQQCAREARRITWVGFWCNALLGALKIVVGLLAASGALVADGVHSLSDFVSDIIVLSMVGIARKKPDSRHLYGHGKYETLATLLLSIVLTVVAVQIMADAVKRIIFFAQGGEIGRPGIWALVICLLSIIVKEWLYRCTRNVGRRIRSEVVVANAWHHRSDAFSSIATLAGVAGAIFLGRAGRLCDPIAAIVVGVFILIVAVKIFRPAIGEMLEVSLPEQELQRISDAVTATPGVRAFHRLRTRRSGANVIIDLHIKVDPTISVSEAHDIATRVEDEMRSLYGSHTTIVTVHVEPYAGAPISGE